MRTIDADELQEEYKKQHDGKRSLLIDVTPTVEPQRMRGRWIPTEPDEPCFYQCSICRRLNDDTDNFCKNCGAWMGGQDGNT